MMENVTSNREKTTHSSAIDGAGMHKWTFVTIIKDFVQDTRTAIKLSMNNVKLDETPSTMVGSKRCI